MGVYRDRVLPRLVDRVLGAEMDDTRRAVTAGLSGQVVEIGFGSGRNLAFLPEAVTGVVAVEPASKGPEIAADRIAAFGRPVEIVGADGAGLDLPDRSADHALSTWTLCTIDHVDAALAELARVLRPGGRLHFVEHGRSPRPEVQRWQRRLNRPWGALAGGCRLDRDPPALLGRAGFEIVELTTYCDRAPELSNWTYRGVARAPRDTAVGQR